MAVETEILEAPAPQCLTTNLGWLLSQASHAYNCEVAAALEPLGLGSRGVCVLSTALGGEYTQTQLARLIGLDKTMMMVTVDDLEAKAYAERKPSATDRRARVIGVTRSGLAKVAEAQRVIDDVQARILDELPKSQRDALLGGLASLVSGALAAPPVCESAPRRRQP
jgi:MarR family transcriptional regulator, transcriptional regulator for hemolysin